MSTTMLALPSGERERPRNLLPMGALLAGAGSLMAFAGLIAGYVVVRDASKVWPPKGVKVDNYLGAILVITALMASVVVEWGASSTRRGQLGQAKGALALAMLFGLAFANGVWYLGQKLGFGVARDAYAGIVYTMVGLSLVNIVVGLGLLVAAFAKVAGRQQGPGDDEVVRAAAWYWQFVVVAWTAVYATLFLLK
jgi:heme/copper-type cytochrome/quinol oxidase subunit 3